MYENEYHLMRSVVKYQADPGRFLWAWTTGKRSKIYPGEAVFLVENHIQALAQWLEGLNGIEFRLLLDTQVDFSHIKFGRSIRKLNMQVSSNEHGITGAPFALVHDPKLTVRQSSIQEITTQAAPVVNNSAAVAQAEPTPLNSPPSYTVH